MKDVIPEDQLSEETKNETETIKEIGNRVNREDLIFEEDSYINNFQQSEIIRSFAKNVFNGKITLNNADENQSNLLVQIMNFKKKNPERNSER